MWRAPILAANRSETIVLPTPGVPVIIMTCMNSFSLLLGNSPSGFAYDFSVKTNHIAFESLKWERL